MKKIVKNYKLFLESLSENNKREFRFFIIEELSNGLKLILTPEGKEELAELDEIYQGDENCIIYDMFDDIQGNSEYKYIDNLGEMGFGLTDANGITDGYTYNDDGEFTTEYPESAKVYYFADYMVRSIIDDLKEYGEVFFNLAK